MSSLNFDTGAGVSVIVPVHGQLPLLRRCVAAVREHTGVPFELILVDNGSEEETARFLRSNADVHVRFDTNEGFAAGMNAGLAHATKRDVVFLNSDAEVPMGWASMLCEHLEQPTVGLVVPAVTRAGVTVTVRPASGTEVIRLRPFSQPPSGVVYAMRTSTARSLGGFSEAYGLGGGEDLDLCFGLWVNDLDVVFDTRVLVEHVSKATVRTVFSNWAEHWDRTSEQFFEGWTSGARPPVRLDTCDAARFERNMSIAASVAGWMQKYVIERRARRLPGRLLLRRAFFRYPAMTASGVAIVRRIRTWTQRTPQPVEGSEH